MVAIGHSTNLIGKDSNIIVIRGGHRPVMEQMIGAVEQFFPESGLLDDEGVVTDVPPRTSTSSASEHPQQHHPLARINTGVSSIVGHDNGERPGGFVLVIDGPALTEVRQIYRYFVLLFTILLGLLG